MYPSTAAPLRRGFFLGVYGRKLCVGPRCWIASMKIRSHFEHNISMLDEAGELLEHLGGTEDYLLAAELYEVALKRWPKARIQMRQAARIVYDSNRSAVV